MLPAQWKKVCVYLHICASLLPCQQCSALHGKREEKKRYQTQIRGFYEFSRVLSITKQGQKREGNARGPQEAAARLINADAEQ